jgi:staphyloferrin B biosynthesis citrate synthase
MGGVLRAPKLLDFLAYAREVVAACHYRGGSRGYATSTRAGGYSSVPMWRHIRESDAAVTVIAQIEDPVALGEVKAIALVEGIDSLFIGRGDLTAAFGNETPNPPEVVRATERIAGAAGKAITVFASGPQEAEWLKLTKPVSKPTIQVPSATIESPPCSALF